MNIAFYVSGAGTRLKNIIKQENIEVNNAIKLVVSDEENKPLEDIVERKKISYICLSEKGYIFSDRLLKEMECRDIDYLFIFGKKMLRGKVLSKYKNRMINFHPSILPLFPGLYAIDQAIEANMSILGNTAHFIDEGMDSGPIILQSVISTDIFYQKGYEGVLKYQEKMFFLLFKLLRDECIVVNEKNRVEIKGSRSNVEELLLPLIDTDTIL